MEKLIYSYVGPVRRFGRIIHNVEEPMYTTAESQRKAVSNIKYTLKSNLGFELNSNIEIEEENVIVDDYANYANTSFEDDKQRVCSKCGYLLNNRGECPVCDLGEEDLLD